MSHWKKLPILLAAAGMAAGCANGAQAAHLGEGAVMTQVAPEELAGIERTLDGVYAVISGEKGEQRDWEAMRALFLPNARMATVGPQGVKSMTVDQYIESSGPILVQVGFQERELGRQLQVYGGLAHAWSAYDGVGNDGDLHIRGINSIQLARQPDGRWLVQSILWQQEMPDLPLPADMQTAD